ncbi:MAG TPA: flagellar basal body rod C-terminal domain-containing protein [Deltaproteobacteria bacterium]|nr:flagellar basal body rod C-terminal domain-containing protein [Deltaproteobacteria bacterium]
MANIIAALNANAALVSNAASNVANLNTRDYQAIRTAIVEDKNGHPSVVTTRSTTPGSILEDGSQSSNVEIPQEFGDMMLARRGFEAALGAIRKRDEMLEDLMDLFA